MPRSRNLAFAGTADLIAEGDYVVGQWIGGGTQTGAAFDDMSIGSLPAATGKTMRFTGITILKVEDGLITEERGLDDGVTVLQQLGLIAAGVARSRLSWPGRTAAVVAVASGSRWRSCSMTRPETAPVVREVAFDDANPRS